MYESDKKFPEREIHRLSGIQFKLPIENRKRGKTLLRERDGNEIYLVDFLKFMVSHKSLSRSIIEIAC